MFLATNPTQSVKSVPNNYVLLYFMENKKVESVAKILVNVVSLRLGAYRVITRQI